MSKALHLLLIVASLTVLVLPTIGLATKEPLLPGGPLEGVVMPAERPRLGLRAMLDESFQRGFSAWFEQNYGARPFATRLDNSIAYFLFGEAPPDKTVRVGKDDVLFVDVQIGYYNRQDRPDVDDYAKKAKRAEDLLLQNGQVLVTMLLPTKTHYWEDAVPDAWRAPLGSPRPCDDRIVEPFAAAMKREGVRFIDGRDSLAALAARDREAIYTRPGRHMTAPAACTVLEDGLALARPLLSDHEIPKLDCRYHMERDVPLIEEEYDLFRLLNVWGPRSTALAPVVDPVPPPPHPERLPDTLVLGTSFGWKIVKEAERNHVLGKIRFHYYVTRVADRDTMRDTPLTLDSPDWPALVESHPLLLMPVIEDFLTADGIEFLERVIAHYEGKAAAKGAP